MNIYVYNFIFTFISFWLFKFSKPLNKHYKLVLVAYFTVVFGQRWNAGVDFQGYLLYYLTKFKTEIGYRIIQNFLYDNNLYYGILIFMTFFFTTVISIFFFSKFCKENISYFVFFLSEYFIMSLNPIRTYIAIQFFLLSIYFFCFRENKVKASIIFLSGALFHKSILMLTLFSIFLKKLKVNRISIILLLLLPLISLRWLLRYTIYSEYLGGKFDRAMSSANILRYYIIVFCFIYLRRYLNRNELREKIIDNCMYIFLFLIGLSVRLAMVHRVAYFFKIFEVIFFMYIYEKIDYRIKNNKLIKKSIVLLFLINYIGIIFKDLGVLKNYRFEKIRLYKDKTDNDYYEGATRFIVKSYNRLKRFINITKISRELYF